MIVISRFRVAEDGGESFLARARQALDAFAACAGYHRGRIGRAADDPTLWTLVTEWAGVGAFRRSLSNFEVKIHAAPLLAESIDEPAAYELLVTDEPPHATPSASVSGRDVAEPSSALSPSRRAADADTTRVGEAATPTAPQFPQAR